MTIADRMTPVSVARNAAESRFEALLGGELSVLTYSESPGQLVTLHTRVPESLEGRGIGSELAKIALEYARSNGLKVVPRCPFVSAFIDHHPEFRELL